MCRAWVRSRLTQSLPEVPDTAVRHSASTVHMAGPAGANMTGAASPHVTGPAGVNVACPCGAKMADPTASITVDSAGVLWAEKVLPRIIEIGVFGGSITFSVVVANPSSPGRFKNSLETFLALAWFFFLISLECAIAAHLGLSLNRKHVNDAYNEKSEPKRTFSQKLACLIFVKLRIVDLLCLAMCVAFLFLSLCVVAYSPVVGWLAVACTAGMIFFLFVVWVTQNKIIPMCLPSSAGDRSK